MKPTNPIASPRRTNLNGANARQLLASLFAGCLLGAVAPSAFAVSDSWTGASDGLWSNTGNWLGGNVPGTGDTATFNAASSFTTIDLGAGVTISNVLFDTASAAAYTIGSGAVGSQTLTLNHLGSISLSAGVANNQSFNANISLPTVANGRATFLNGSSSALTIAGAVNSVPASGNSLLTVTNVGPVTISGTITETGAGNNALFKRGAGTLTLSGGSTWSGTGASSGGFSGPLFAQEGVLIFNGTNTVNGELVIGGVVANGGPGQNAKIQVDGGLLNVTTWLSVGRGNGVGGVSSDLELNNNAKVTTANVSAGFNGGSGLNFPKGSITLNGTSSLLVNGNFFIGESSGSDFTLTINDSATITNTGGNVNRISSSGKALLVVNGGIYATEGDVFLNFDTSGPTNGATAVVKNGGVLSVSGATSTAKRWLIFKRTGDAQTDLIITNNGTLKLNNNTDLRYSTVGGGGVNTVTVADGGAIIGYSDRSVTVGGTTVIDLQQGGAASAATNVFNLDNGGSVQVREVISAQASATRVFNFNGGTLKPNANTANFFNLGAGNARANVRNGGAIFDTAGFDVSVVSQLQHSDILTDNATDGGLTKNGAGKLTLSGGHTYTGPTVVNGGTLQLNPSMVFPSTPGDYTVSGAALTLDLTSGGSYNSTTLSAGNVSFSGTSTLNLTYGAVSGAPTAAINASGSLSSSGTVTINVTATGLGLGVVPLISFGSGAATTNGFILGSLPSGVTAVLTNNSANTLDLLITSAGKLLTWRGHDGDGVTPRPNWNISSSTNWFDTLGSVFSQYQEYGSVGDNVIFDDNGAFVTNINLTANVKPATLLVSSTYLPYSITGAGSIGGAVTLVKTNGGSLFLGTSNSYTGGTIIGGDGFGGTGALVITNDNALGAPAGGVTLAGGTLQLDAGVTSSRSVVLTANSMLAVPNNVTAQLSGIFSGAGGLTKTDNGTLILAGANTNTGATTVSGGTLNVPAGGAINNAATPNVGLLTVGNTAGTKAILDISGGAVNALFGNGNEWSGFMNVGSTAGAVGDIRMSSGSLAASRHLVLGNGAGAYGAMTMNNGSLSVGSYFIVGFAGGYSVFNQSGGVVQSSTAFTGSTTLIGSGDNSIGVANVSGGSFISTNAGISISENGASTGILNVSGSANLVAGNAGLRFGNNAATSSGTLNLLGGTATVNRVWKANGAAMLNFNGGTLKASGANATFLTGLDAATVYSGGAVIDDGGFNIGIDQPLVAPAGDGVSSIAVTDGGSNYVDAPVVSITGDGTNATAVATVSGGVVTGIVITSPGTGYTYASASLLGGIGSDGIAATLGTPTLSANTGGGLTKLGNGTLTLSGASTYTGNTVVNAGKLLVTPAHQATGGVSVANGASYGVSLTGAPGTVTNGAITLASGATALSFSLGTNGNPVAPLIVCGPLTNNGTLTVTLGGTVSKLTVGSFPLVKYTGAIQGGGSLNPVVAGPQGSTITLSNSVADSTLYAVISSLGGGIVWTGTNANPALANLWDLNSTTNWLSGGNPTTYHETTPPGDAVVFNDIGSGLVLLSNTASPASVTISNVGVNYTFQGTGSINSIGGLTKVGSGTATLSIPGTYSSSTVVSDGTLSLGANQSFANLTGNGTIATASGSPTLTVANSENTTFSGAMQGALGVTKTGNGTLTLSNTSAFSGAFNVNQGTVNFSGANTASTASTATMVVGSASGSATVNFTPGATLSRNNLLIGNATGVKGTVNATNATLDITGGGELWIGGSANDIQTDGEFNLVGGSVTVNNWTAIGRSFGASGKSTGVLNINDGAWTNAGANNFVICSAPNNVGIVNITNGGVLYKAHNGSGNQGQIWVGEQGNGILNLHGGSVIAARTAVPALVVGRAANSAGSIRQHAGWLESSDQTFLGHDGTGATGSYGEMNLMGGTNSSRSYYVVGRRGDNALFRQSGGLFVQTNVFMTIGADNTTSRGVADLSGGTFTTLGVANVADSGIWVGEYGSGTLNVRGTATVNLSGTATGGGLRVGGFADSIGTVNLLGGTLNTPRIAKGNVGTNSTFNFNGGLLQATLANPAFMTNLDMVMVYAGGARINDGGNAIGIATPLLAPSGVGVTNVVVYDGGSNYIGAPLVRLENGVPTGNGLDATAVANMIPDGSTNGTFKVGSITITCPGDYTFAPTTVTFLGGGQNVTAAQAYTIETASNVSGGLTKTGSGTLNLNGVNTYTGTTTISNGTLGGIGTLAGPVVVTSGASLAPGGSIGTLTINNDLTLAGDLAIEVNTSVAPSNDLCVVTGTATYTGSGKSVIVTNLGPALVAGDTFKLFSGTLVNGQNLAITGVPGVTWTNELATLGQIRVLSVAPTLPTDPTNITFSVSGSTLSLSWPSNYLGWILQSQTNSRSVGLNTNWFDVPGSASVTSTNLSVNATNPTVFFRLRYP